jgi:hypothetical protein
MSNLSDFLNERKIAPEKLVEISQSLEKLSIEERELMTKREAARRNKKTYAELSLEKPKSRGRGITMGTLQRALDGQPVARLTRHKITRAVNAALASAKQEPIDWRPLFTDVKSRKGKPAKAKK